MKKQASLSKHITATQKLAKLQMPTVCRRVVCAIGGHAEAREAVEQAGVNVLVARTQAGVLAFGTDTDVRKAFGKFNITDFDLHTIDTKRLRYDSGERGLFRKALTQAIEHRYQLNVIHRQSADLLAPANPNEAIWAPLKQLVGSLNGSVRGFPDLHTAFCECPRWAGGPSGHSWKQPDGHYLHRPVGG